MPTPLPHQIVGAQFLASRPAALLADEPRVGKTGTAIMACDLVLARRILVVTTATGRANFGREFVAWQAFPRRVQVLYGALDTIDPIADVLVVGWSVLADARLYGRLAEWGAEVLVLDESHYAKSPEAKRTGAAMQLARTTAHVICLSGTPMPNAPNDLWALLSVMAPERIDGMTYDAFLRRFCVVKPKFMGGKRIDVVIGGRNLDELRARLAGFWLRRTQADVGIREPRYATLALEPCGHPALQVTDETQAVLDAIETGETAALEMHMGPLRRLTGSIKAPLVAAFVEEEFGNGLDRIVLMCWHAEVIDFLSARLAAFGVAKIDGRTAPAERQHQVDRFNSEARVFVGQITAAGEAIDLSSSCNLIFVEASFVPKDLKQAALRITNHGQKRQALVRFAAIAGSIDEAIMTVLTRKVATIKEVLRP